MATEATRKLLATLATGGSSIVLDVDEMRKLFLDLGADAFDLCGEGFFLHREELVKDTWQLWAVPALHKPEIGGEDGD